MSEYKEIKGRFKSADPQRQQEMHEDVRTLISAPPGKRPTTFAKLAEKHGVTVRYLYDIKQRIEREQKAEKTQPKLPAEQLDAIRAKILEGDLAVIEQYKPMALKLLDQAIK